MGDPAGTTVADVAWAATEDAARAATAAKTATLLTSDGEERRPFIDELHAALLLLA